MMLVPWNDAIIKIAPRRACFTEADRLARSTRDLLNTINVIIKAEAEFRSLVDAVRHDHAAWQAIRIQRI
jgi:hypothetical protein